MFKVEGGDELPEGGEMKMTAGDVDDEDDKEKDTAKKVAAPASTSGNDGVEEVGDKVGKVALGK